PTGGLGGEEAAVAGIERSLDAIAVELDLVRPPAAAWRNVVQGGERRRYELGQARAVRRPILLLAPVGVALARSLRCAAIARTARTLLRSFLRVRARQDGMTLRCASLDVLLHAFIGVPNPL